MNPIRAIAAALFLAALAPSAPAQMIARVEMHAFASATLTDQQFLSGEQAGMDTRRKRAPVCGSRLVEEEV